MIDKKGLLLVISGPSGAGKGTICKKLVEDNKNIKLSVSATTRKPREGEVEGISYYFKTKEEFEEMIRGDEFLEHAKIYDNSYGTPKKQIFEELDRGNDVILEIEMQGAMQIKRACPEAVFIFIIPPSLEELKNRIISRGTETVEQIEKRFKSAFGEIKLLGDYDYFVVNESVDEAVKEVLSIICAEKSRVTRYKKEIFELFERESAKC